MYSHYCCLFSNGMTCRCVTPKAFLFYKYEIGFYARLSVTGEEVIKW